MLWWTALKTYQAESGIPPLSLLLHPPLDPKVPWGGEAAHYYFPLAFPQQRLENAENLANIISTALGSRSKVFLGDLCGNIYNQDWRVGLDIFIIQDKEIKNRRLKWLKMLDKLSKISEPTVKKGQICYFYFIYFILFYFIVYLLFHPGNPVSKHKGNNIARSSLLAAFLQPEGGGLRIWSLPESLFFWT